MTNEQILKIMRTTLQIKKEPVAIKVWKNEPAGIAKYGERAFPGMCAQIGELLKTGTTFYTDREQCFCTGGVVATGVAPALNEEERDEMVKVHFEVSRGYKDIPTAMYYEKQMDKIQPKVGESNAAVQLGLFKDISDPDLVLIFCNPGTADILNRAYTYVSGEPVSGFGGNGACPFAIQYPYITKKPSFTYSDVSWRKYVGMTDDELTMSFPFQSLVQFIEYLPVVAEEYRNYGEMPGA
jgi:uncharacterized protein (DUF169 family)